MGNHNCIRIPFVFSAENLSFTPAENSELDLLLKCVLFPPLDAKSMKNSISVFEVNCNLGQINWFIFKWNIIKSSSRACKLYRGAR